MKGGAAMNRRIIRLITAVALVGVLTVSYAIPASCANYVNLLPAKNDGTMIGVDIGNDFPQKYKVGGEIVTVRGYYACDHYLDCCNGFYNCCSHYTATGTNSGGCELPYSKISTAGPVARTLLSNAATSLGLRPGGAFGLEIGKYTCYSGYTPCAKLNAAMNYEMIVCPIGTPVMLALLPNGAVTMLSDAEFDKNTGIWYANGTCMYYLHTYYPDAVYMLAYK